MTRSAGRRGRPDLPNGASPHGNCRCACARGYARSPENNTLTFQVFSLVGGRYQIEWDYVMVATLVASVPAAVVFALLQRYLVSGLTVGAVK